MRHGFLARNSKKQENVDETAIANLINLFVTRTFSVQFLVSHKNNKTSFPIIYTVATPFALQGKVKSLNVSSVLLLRKRLLDSIRTKTMDKSRIRNLVRWLTLKVMRFQGKLCVPS